MPEHNIEHASWRPDTATIHRDSPFDPSVVCEAALKPDFIGFLRALSAPATMVAAEVLTGLQSVAASTFATNELSFGLPLH